MKLSCNQRNVTLCVLSTVVTFAALMMSGCTTSSDGKDLTEVGVLSMVIEHAVGSSVASATAEVSESGVFASKIALADDQVLYIDDAEMTPTPRTALGLDSVYAANAAAVDRPDTYSLRFDNQGVISTYEATPPEAFEDLLPEADSEVERNGFTLTWDTSSDTNTSVKIVIAGTALQLNADNSVQVIPYEITLDNVADNGSHAIGLTELNLFLEGDITVTLTRIKTISQKLGFSAGTIQLTIAQDLPLTLVDPETQP